MRRASRLSRSEDRTPNHRRVHFRAPACASLESCRRAAFTKTNGTAGNTAAPGPENHATLSELWKASDANPSEPGSKAGVHGRVSLHELRLSSQLASSDLAHQVQIHLLALHALHQLRDRRRPQRHKTRPRGFGLEEPHQSDSAFVGSALEQVCGLPPPVLRLASAPARFRRTRLMVAGGLAPPITPRTGTTSGS